MVIILAVIAANNINAVPLETEIAASGMLAMEIFDWLKCQPVRTTVNFMFNF